MNETAPTTSRQHLSFIHRRSRGRWRFTLIGTKMNPSLLLNMLILEFSALAHRQTLSYLTSQSVSDTVLTLCECI